MTRSQLFDKIKEKESFLCVGLDPDLEKIPKEFLKTDDPIFEFNKAVIDATLPYAVAYKPNLAFYECHGSEGWESLQKTIEYLPDNVFKIADAKRGDIGNTSLKYAEAFFGKLKFDAITISPYMGEDSIRPFIDYGHKWVIVLASTSNEGSLDFQDLMVDNSNEKLYERVIRKTMKWGSEGNTMFVIGATRVETLLRIRTVCPDHFLLIPGIGAQGGDLDLVCKYGMNRHGGLLINSSRSIIYAGSGDSFKKDVELAAKKLQHQMAAAIVNHGHW